MVTFLCFMQASDTRELMFEKIFSETKDRVYGFLKKILRENSKAEDCMQQCYLKLWETLDTIDTEQDLLPLLYTYSRNISIDMLRKNTRYIWMDDLSSFSETLTEERTPQAYINQKEAVYELEHILDQMPARRRQVFKLIRLSGFSYKETAQQLNISVSTVEKHMHEAHKMLEV
jgi:RNA polymerase sigma factor (sigma-70 family)